MGLVFNDTILRQGFIQGCEDTCGLGATGITGDTALFQKFTRWMNQWHKIAANYAMRSFDGHDFDDPNYTTDPSGTFAGQTAREYIFDSAYKMLKIKSVSVTYDGTNYYPASAFDDAQRLDISIKDPNVDSKFSKTAPQYDPSAGGFKLYPTFVQADVDAGAKVYVEWWRTPREFATTGTDAYTAGIDSPFEHILILGPSYEYAKLYNPELAASLKFDIYGGGVRYGAKVPGLLNELQNWYSGKQSGKNSLQANVENTR